MAPPRGRGRNHGRSAPRKAAAPNLPQLPGPVNNHDQILKDYGQNVTIKKVWEENPKAPLANHLGGGTGGAKNLGDGGGAFLAVEALVDGQKVFRVTVDAGDGLQGVGDAPSRKEAEKLAALSAVLQLAGAGLVGRARLPLISSLKQLRKQHKPQPPLPSLQPLHLRPRRSLATAPRSSTTAHASLWNGTAVVTTLPSPRSSIPL